MANAKKVEVTAAELKTSNKFWLEFMKFTKYGVIAIVVFLGLLALFLV